MSAAAMAPGGAAAGGGGGGSGGNVLHFVGSCCGELGTNSNQTEAQKGASLKRLCLAVTQAGRPRQCPGGGPRGSERQRRQDSESQALLAPSAKMEAAHFLCAAASPSLAMGLTPASSRTWRSQPLPLLVNPALPPERLPPAQKGSKYQPSPPCVNSCQPRCAKRPRREPHACVRRTGQSSCLLHFHPTSATLSQCNDKCQGVGAGNVRRSSASEKEQKWLKGWALLLRALGVLG